MQLTSEPNTAPSGGAGGHAARAASGDRPAAGGVVAVEPPSLAFIREALETWYRDIEWIGSGRCGLVVRGRPVSGDHDWVAIKIAYPGLPPSSDAVQRFLREARVGAKLHHPSIAPVWPVRRERGLTWFEMPFMGGNRLDHFMRNERHLTVARAMEILHALAGALDYAASQGVAHGALRPSEVFILPDGHCVLTGFMLDLTSAEDSPALAPSALGDHAYMVPEQWADRPSVGPAADQYALAVLTAELIGGVERVTRDDHGVAMVVPLGIAHDRPLRPGMGLHVTDALLRALSRDPWLRYPNCRAFVHALGDPVPTMHHRHEAADGPAVPAARHHWWHAAIVAAALLAAAALLVIR